MFGLLRLLLALYYISCNGFIFLLISLFLLFLLFYCVANIFFLQILADIKLPIYVLSMLPFFFVCAEKSLLRSGMTKNLTKTTSFAVWIAVSINYLESVGNALINIFIFFGIISNMLSVCLHIFMILRIS